MLNSPFLQAGASKSLASNLLRGSKFSFNGIITNLEKTVSTINQVVPLYNQVKPLITNSKTIINAFKGTRNNKANESSNKITKPSQNIVTVNYKEVKDENTSEKLNDFFINHNAPNKPFFNQ